MQKIKAFFRKLGPRGYYIALGICALAVAVSALLYVGSLRKPQAGLTPETGPQTMDLPTLPPVLASEQPAGEREAAALEPASEAEPAGNPGTEAQPADAAPEQELPAEPAGQEDEPAEPAGQEHEPAEPAGQEHEPAEPAGQENEPAEPAGQAERTPEAPAGPAEADPPAPVSTRPLTVQPLLGELSKPYCMDRLSFNLTTRDWRTHAGLDIAAVIGSPVRAAADGVVLSVYEDDALGRTVTLRHLGGWVTHYANLDELVPVSAGDEVHAGQIIGAVGRTALAELGSEPHLHFEVYLNNVPQDPEDFLEP